LSFSSGDYFSKWREDYPIVNEIQALAVDLSWSNATNVDEDWEKLLNYIHALEQQVKAFEEK